MELKSSQADGTKIARLEYRMAVQLTFAPAGAFGGMHSV